MTNFDFARALGKTGADALNADIEKHATSGRVHAVLISTAAAHGLDMPANKAGFATFSVELLTKEKAKGLPTAIGRALALSCAAVRKIMGLETLSMADWVTSKPTTRKPTTVKAPSLEAITAAIAGGLYDAAALATIAAAITAAAITAAAITAAAAPVTTTAEAALM
jgi:hypothetical protein